MLPEDPGKALRPRALQHGVVAVQAWQGRGKAGAQPEDPGATPWSRAQRSGVDGTILGNAYGDLEDFPKQKDLLERSPEIKEKIYGPDHPQAALILNPLGKGTIVESPTWPGH